MTIKQIVCQFLGHKKEVVHPELGIDSAWKCTRCGHYTEHINWPKGIEHHDQKKELK